MTLLENLLYVDCYLICNNITLLSGAFLQQNILSNSHKHDDCVSRAKSKFIERLQEMGKVVGKNDETVLKILLTDHRVFSAYDIAEKISHVGKRVQPIQVYRSLKKLINLGVVHKLATKNGFIACYDEGKCTFGQFLICNKCDSVQEIDNKPLNHQIHDSAQASNFTVTGKSVEVLGVCQNCQ